MNSIRPEGRTAAKQRKEALSRHKFSKKESSKCLIGGGHPLGAYFYLDESREAFTLPLCSYFLSETGPSRDSAKRTALRLPTILLSCTLNAISWLNCCNQRSNFDFQFSRRLCVCHWPHSALTFDLLALSRPPSRLRGSRAALTIYPSSSFTVTSFISLISLITIACVPVRSNTIPLARTYLPTNGISTCR